MSELLPCRKCGAACRVEVFGPNKAIETPMPVWICANSIRFGATCDESTYLSEAAWNIRMTDTLTNALVSEAMIKQAWADFVNCQDDQYFGHKTEMEKQFTVLRKFAAAIAAMSARSPVGWEDEARAMIADLDVTARNLARADHLNPAVHVMHRAADLLQKIAGVEG